MEIKYRAEIPFLHEANHTHRHTHRHNTNQWLLLVTTIMDHNAPEARFSELTEIVPCKQRPFCHCLLLIFALSAHPLSDTEALITSQMLCNSSSHEKWQHFSSCVCGKGERQENVFRAEMHIWYQSCRAHFLHTQC